MSNPKTLAEDELVGISAAEQGHLVEAIEAAMRVNDLDQLHAWIRGPFRALLPHDSVMCIETDARNGIHRVECLYHELRNHVDHDHPCHLRRPREGLAGLACAAGQRQSCLIDAEVVNDLFTAERQHCDPDHGPLRDAVVHPTRFLSGAAYHVVLFNVPQTIRARSHRLLNLLSSHMKMVLAKVIDLPTEAPVLAPATALAITPTITPREREILAWMRRGHSNQQISVALGISPITVKSHVQKIFRKLGVQNRADAVARHQQAEPGDESLSRPAE